MSATFRAARVTALVVALGVTLAACSRASAEGDVVPPAPTPKEDRRERAARSSAAAEEIPEAGPAARAPRSFAGKVVLHVGDSMVGGSGGLARALEAKFVAAGASFHRDTVVSETIASFDRARKPSALLARTKADIVILTLGANDVFLPHPEVLTKHVERIAERIGARECYWMGPPLWKPDTGVVAILEAHASPCRFFSGKDLALPRAGDGIHPTDRGGALWADAFWAFLEAQEP